MKFIKYFFALFLLSGSYVSCDKNDNDTVGVTGDKLATVIANNPDLSIFKAAIDRAKLNYFFDGAGPFTVYAPNNAAFNAAGIMSAADLNNIDTTTLITLLTYHFAPGDRTSFEIPNGPNAAISTQGGLSFFSAKSGDNIFINGARIVTRDIATANGRIHIIDNVLFLPSNTMLGTLTANPNHKLFVQLINKTAQTASFASTATVFAPTNAAMVAAGYDSTAIANLSAANITLLGNVVKYHVLPVRLFSSEFKDISYKTLQEQTLLLLKVAQK